MAEFIHKRLGLRLVLAEAEDLRQRDVEKYMRAYRDYKLGDSAVEAHGKSLRAALRTGWVKAITPEIDEHGVGDLAPAQVRWLGQKIDALYLEATAIPPDVIVEAAAHGEDPKSESAAG